MENNSVFRRITLEKLCMLHEEFRDNLKREMSKSIQDEDKDLDSAWRHLFFLHISVYKMGFADDLCLIFPDDAQDIVDSVIKYNSIISHHEVEKAWYVLGNYDDDSCIFKNSHDRDKDSSIHEDWSCFTSCSKRQKTKLKLEEKLKCC